MNHGVYKKALNAKRTEILAGGGGKQQLQTPTETNTNTRQGDLADQATGTNEVHIQLKVKQTDAKILQAIEEALLRMDQGTYGNCRDCGETIAAARLNAIPWTRVCITCKEQQSS
jgi:DnaK suppressor protein